MTPRDTNDGWRVRVAARCTVGPVREHLEDEVAVFAPGARAVVVAPDCAPLATDVGVGLLVLDGMGGQHTGDVPCRLIVASLTLEFAGTMPDEAGARGAWLFDALCRAGARVEADGTQHAGQAAAAALAVVYGDVVHIVHVGDVRVYLLRDGQLAQRTRDDSLANRLRDEGHDEAHLLQLPRGILTQALGHPGAVPHLDAFAAWPGDVLLLCSDGLHEWVAPAAIEAVLREVGDPDRACAELVALAFAANSEDNITVMVARVERGA